MNYFNLHIGDYVAATAHLSLLEDAIYGRLLRRYYMQESALPEEVAKVARLAGARSPEEVEAVQVVLEEFFTLEMPRLPPTTRRPKRHARTGAVAADRDALPKPSRNPTKPSRFPLGLKKKPSRKLTKNQ